MSYDLRDEIYDPSNPLMKFHGEVKKPQLIVSNEKKNKVKKFRNKLILVDLAFVFLIGIFAYIIYPKYKEKGVIDTTHFFISSYIYNVEDYNALSIDNLKIFSALEGNGQALVCNLEIIVEDIFETGFANIEVEFYNKHSEFSAGFDLTLLSESYENFVFYLPYDGVNDIINIYINGWGQNLKLRSAPQ